MSKAIDEMQTVAMLISRFFVFMFLFISLRQLIAPEFLAYEAYKSWWFSHNRPKNCKHSYSNYSSCSSAAPPTSRIVALWTIAVNIVVMLIETSGHTMILLVSVVWSVVNEIITLF
jgi:hypothetical protein